MAKSAQTKVTKTKTMSIDAKRLFLRPNCRGVKAKLKTRFNMKGNATEKGICLVKSL